MYTAKLHTISIFTNYILYLSIMSTSETTGLLLILAFLIGWLFISNVLSDNGLTIKQSTSNLIGYIIVGILLALAVIVAFKG